MSELNNWMVAVIGLLPPLGAAAFLALRGRSERRLIAGQFAAATTVLIVVLLAMAGDETSFLDLALALVLVGYAGTLVYAHFLERWL